MIETNRYIKFKNVKENDDQIFFADIEGFRILGIADGVSECSKGRVASATLCFALSKYFNEHPIKGELTEYVNNAIEYAIEELQEVKALFEEHFDNLFEPKQLSKNTLTESDSFKETATTTQEEVEHPMEISENLEVPSPSSITETQTEEPKKEKAEKESRLDEDIPIANESDIELKTEIEDGKTIPVTNELETKLQEIFYYLKEFNTEEYQDAKDFVKSLLKTVKKEDDSFIFQTTLSLNILKQGSEFAELNSFNFGDSETLIISVNPSKADINSHISHYRLQQGPLKSYISSSKGKNGRLDISTRKLYENDLLFIGSDGTYFSKTSKVSGNPFSPLHNLIIDCLRKNKLDELPNLWFGKLKSMNALDDDFSLFLITCNKKIEDVKESKDANSFETL